MKNLIRKALRKIGRVMTADIQEQTRSHTESLVKETRRVDAHLKEVEADVKKLQKPSIEKLQQIESALDKAEAYQPLYGMEGLNIGKTPIARTNSKERAEVVARAFGENIHGMRFVDVGSSLGYVSFYLADRGAKVEGWDFRAENVAVANLAHEINKVDNVSFKTREMTLDVVKGIQPGRFDGVVILSVLHHTVMYRGLEYTQDLMYELLQRVPVVVVELAQKGEDKKLKWDKTLPEKDTDVFKKAKELGISIEKLGSFETHLSGVKRPLYKISRDHVTVDHKNFPYDGASRKAYEGSQVRSARVFYTGQEYFIKEYALSRSSDDTNKKQIINEINFYLNSSHLKIPNIPKMVAYELRDTVAYLVLEKIDGALLDETNRVTYTLEIDKVAKQLISTLAELEKHHLFHNDIRSWNVIVERTKVVLIDFGMVGSEEIENNKIAFLWVLHAAITHERESTEVGKTELPPREAFTYAHTLKIYDAVAENPDITFREIKNLR